MDDRGGNSAQSRENLSESFRLHHPTGSPNAATLADSSEVTLDEAIQMHLVDCDQCRKVSLIARPVALGQKSGHCDTYWAMQLLRADLEGRVNNIVAYTEYGDEARKGGALE